MLKMRSRPPQPDCRLAAATVAFVLACAVALSGCGSTIGRLPLIGEREGIPPAPAVAPPSPSIGAGPKRPEKPMTAAELKKAQDELNAARTQGPDERRKKIKEPSTP
jgi:hypothetical protein